MTESLKTIVAPNQVPPRRGTALFAEPGRLGPAAILTAMVLGSAVAIEFGLLAVWVIFAVLRSQSAQVAFEIGRLPIYCAVFMGLVIFAAAAFYSWVKALTWRFVAQGLMWGMVLAIGLWFTWGR